MPSLKQLTCNIEWTASGSSLPLQEYGTTYSDGIVETYIVVPEVPTPFAIRLKSDGYIAPGLSMFVYIDGEYQCNRGRNNLKIPDSTTHERETNVNFVVRQKEKPIRGGGFFGCQWIFGTLEVLGPKAEYMDTIEVVVLRSAGVQRAKAPDASVSEKHPMAFAANPVNRGEPESAEDRLSSFGALFDGPSDVNDRRSHMMPFGGDMAWDDDHRREQTRPGHGWNTSSRPDYQPKNTGKPGGRSGSVVSQAATPAIIINVNQPAVASPSPWPTAETRPWDKAGASDKDSWDSAPATRKVDDSWQTWIKGAAKPADSRPWDTAGSSDKDSWGSAPATPKVDNSWQTWIKGAQNSQQPSFFSDSASKDKPGNKEARGKDHTGNAAWPASDHQRRSSHTQSVLGGWNTGNQNQKAQDNGRGWNDEGRNPAGRNTAQTSPQQGDFDWNNSAKNSSYSRYDGGGHQDNWNTGSNINNQDNSGWANGGSNGNWNEHQNDQGNWDNNGDQDWNADQDNGQGWNGNGQDEINYDQDNKGYDSGNYNDSGKDWNNANTGAQEAQASASQDWNITGNNGGSWGKTGDNPPTTGGAFDPTKPRSRGASFGRAQSAVKSLSKQASIRSATRKSGWPPSGLNPKNNAEPSGTVPKSFEPPGAWPEIPQAAAGLEPSNNGPNPLTKPYHVTVDAAGNPRRPPAPPFARAPTPPLPPTADLSFRVHQGEPVLYQHKVASPKYIDTHDKPYAVFTFRYRTKGQSTIGMPRQRHILTGGSDAVEKMLNISVPPSEDVEKAKLVNLSKEELIAEVIKTKSSMGSKADTSSTNSILSAPPSVNNFANTGNGLAGPSGGGFGAALNDKLAALAVENKDSSSSGNNNNPGWNNAPPGSPVVNNGNGTFGAPWPGHAPTPPKWNAQNNSNWNGDAVAGLNGGGGGGHVETWLNKTPAVASASGHKPWGGSVKNSGSSNKGASGNNQSQNWSSGHRGGSQTGKDQGTGGGGGSWANNQNNSNGRKGWEGCNNGGSGGMGDRSNSHAGAGGSQKAGPWNHAGGRGSQAGDWNRGGNNGGQASGWNTNGGDGNKGGNGDGGWNTSGEEKAGGDEPVW
ncbi:MAG: hypothetical protein Q9216_003563 [Gyalolechia sp. 2 TL-2023]